MDEKVAVRNAADKSQVKEAEKNDENIAEEQRNDIVKILNTPEGRRLIWRIMSRCQSFNSVKKFDNEHTYMAIGAQDLGHWLMTEVVNADENLLFNMMKENMEKCSKGDK